MCALTSCPEELNVIPELRTFMISNRIENLSELLKFSVTELMGMEGFSYRCLTSLNRLLEENGMGSYLKDFPSR